VKIPALIADINATLTDTFTALDGWFDQPRDLRAYRPGSGGWTVDEILEHVGLTNHFLLILIDKGTTKALQNLRKLELAAELESYVFHRDQLLEIGQHRSFAWIRPAHMEPTGTKPLAEVRDQLRAQLAQCRHYLDLLKNGEGVLYKTTMTVNGLGKIDVYEYLYFLAQHGRRHLEQMAQNEREFRVRPA